MLSEAKNEPMTNWPGLIELTPLPTFSTTPQYSCPLGVGSVMGCRLGCGTATGLIRSRN